MLGKLWRAVSYSNGCGGDLRPPRIRGIVMDSAFVPLIHPYLAPMRLTLPLRAVPTSFLTLLIACGGGDKGPQLGPPATLEVVTGGGQTVPINEAAAISPSFKVKDAAGNALPGIAIRFTLEQNGGSVTPDRVVTGANGVASVASWVVGNTPGVSTLRAQVENGTLSNSVSVTTIVALPPTITVISGQNLLAFAGQAVTPLPVVEVRDGFGVPKAGLAVTFLATAGGGTLPAAPVITDALGRASPASWTLGATAGVNTMRAQLPNGDYVTFTAQGLAAPLSVLEPISPTVQNGILGFQIPQIPRVRVRDALGNPVPNIPVTFALVGFGDATLQGPVGISDANGVAAPLDWKLGLVNNSSTVRATLASFPGPNAEFRVTGTSQPFVIDLRILSAMKPSTRDAFVVAAQRWMSIIVGDVPDINISKPAGDCGSNSPAVTEFVDDLIIFATVEAIDGPGGVLGSAGPCTIRSPSALPIVGRMRFDNADLDVRETNGQLVDLILHEMGHVLGFGTVWTNRNVIDGRGTADPIFVGTQSLALWPSLTLGYFGRPVPVENGGGSGTADSHWRESIFDAELMTGYIESPGVLMPLSKMTIASMLDLGYAVSYAGADNFAGSLLAILRDLNSVPEKLNEVLVYPTSTVESNGISRTIPPR